MDERLNTFYKTFIKYKNKHLDDLRHTDYKTLDDNGEVYLDYTGGGLYALSQLKAHMKLLETSVLGNPHSDNPTSLRSTNVMNEARQAVLEFFNADPNEYCVIFTPNASGSLRLVGESYPFTKDSTFLQLADNHNSVNGIREFARRGGASIDIIKSKQDDLQVNKTDIIKAVKRHTGTASKLFAYPAQSNFSGVQHPLEWIDLAHANGWDVLLDAAAFVPTNKLDLQEIKPDYVALSFYKMFGWPTGVGCLLARKKALEKLQRPWFSGGTIWALSVQGDWHVMAPEYEAFEDGTVNYLNLPAITIGLNHIKKVGIDAIHDRVTALTGWLLQELQTLQHANGQPLIVLYGPKNTASRGGTIAFNFLTPEGRIVDERVVNREAKKRGISLRTGCFCNPGSGEITFGLEAQKLADGKGEGNRKSFDEYLAFLGLQSAGAIRISFGIASTIDDAEYFLDFAKSFMDTEFDTSDLPERGHC